MMLFDSLLPIRYDVVHSVNDNGLSVRTRLTESVAYLTDL